jgi:hypothetical protein
MDFLVFRLHRRVNSHTQVRRGILVERCGELETKHGSKAEMNLHGRRWNVYVDSSWCGHG